MEIVTAYETFSFLTILLAVAIFMRLYHRTSSQLPGPLALPFIGHLQIHSPRLHHTFHQLSQSYGPLIQLYLGSVPCLVASTPELAKEFLKTNELTFSSRKISTAINIVTYNSSSFAFSPYGPYWKFIKKLCTNELLSARNVNHLQSIRTLEINSFLRLLVKKSESGECVNLSEELMKLTSSIISHTMLGMRCSDTEAARMVIRDVTTIFGEFDISDLIWFCKNFDLQGIKKRSRDIKGRYDALLEKIITEKERTRRGVARGGSTGHTKDFLDLLLDVMDGGKSEVTFTREHLKALILDFFTAGTDTTAISVEWAISELINNPHVLKKAQKEIDNVVGSQRLVQESDASNLPYLQAIIKETFRLHPPIPMLIRKSISDCVVDGKRIPKKTILFVNIWSIGRNPNYWERPTEFRPERFLQSGKDDSSNIIDVKGQNFELLPFGTGRRGCPGMLLAMHSLFGVLGSLVQCFDVNVPDGSEIPIDMTEKAGLTAPRANDLVCRLKPRRDSDMMISCDPSS